MQLRAQGVTVRFGGLVAVDEVSISLARGEILGLIGPNGAGKTTLVNVLSGFQRPLAGAVTGGGRDCAGLPPPRLAPRRRGADLSGGPAVPRPDCERKRRHRLRRAGARPPRGQA